MNAKYEVYINYKLIDLPEDIEFPLNLQIYDITTFGSISCDYSKTITIPRTLNNDLVLEHSALVNSGSNLPYRRLPIKVNKGGLEIISRGWCYIVQSNSKEYEITVHYGTYDFLTNLENKYLKDLVSPELDHDINWYNIFHSSFEQYRWTKPYVYPLIEWGDGSLIIEDNLNIIPPYINSGEDVNVERLLPVLNAKWIIEQTIIQAGYTYHDPDNLIEYFANKYISLTNLADDITSEQIRLAEAEIPDGEGGTIFFHYVYLNMEVLSMIGTSNQFWSDFLVLECKNITKQYFNQIQNSNMYYDWDTRKMTVYKVPAPCDLRVKITVTLQVPPVVGFYGEGFIHIVVHDGYTYKLDEPVEVYDAFAPKYPNYLSLKREMFVLSGDQGNPTIDLEYFGSFQYGDYISVVAEITNWPIGYTRTLYPLSANFTFDFPESVAKNTGYGFHLSLGKNLPEILQKDFFKHCMFMRNIVVSTNYYDKIVYLNKFDDIFDNIKNARDWTEKVSIDDNEKLTCIPEVFYKRNHFKYQADDILNKSVGAGYFDINNQNLETSDDFYESPFFVCDTIRISKYFLEILKIKMYDYGYNVVGSQPRFFVLTESPYPDNDVADKYLNYISVSQDINYRTKYHIHSYFVSDDQYTRALDDMDFAKLLPRHHYRLIDILQRYKEINPIIILSDTDILNFNPLVPIRLEQYSGYFYANLIKDYIDGATEVQMIKLF